MDEIQQLNEQLANAVKERNVERVKELIGDGAEVNVVYRYGFTPLHLAINSGCKEIVGFLLDKGAYTKIGPSICQAVSCNDKDMVKFLLAKGESVNAIDQDENTPLYLAALHGYKEMAEFLLEEGSNINAVNLFGFTPLSLSFADRVDVVTLIVNHIAKLETVGFYVSEENLQRKDEFINTSNERRNNYLQHFQNCQREAKKIEKENKPLYDFLRESNIDNLVSIWERNKNVRSKFGNQESLQEQYPEYAHILISKANEVEKEIFLHNHKPLIDALSTHYKCDFKTMTLAGIKNFFEVHRSDFRKELGSGGITLNNFVNFGDVAKRHVPTLKVQAFAEFVRNNAPSRNLSSSNAEQHLGLWFYCSIL